MKEARVRVTGARSQGTAAARQPGKSQRQPLPTARGRIVALPTLDFRDSSTVRKGMCVVGATKCVAIYYSGRVKLTQVLRRKNACPLCLFSPSSFYPSAMLCPPQIRMLKS